ncbi:MAG: GDP-mannose 4,6-dehydratase [Candidatus Aenigmarchaeota archaeon]|nr:GDP-mannose 4,6-dehydratase [Candidatus Aenigmarchaeota archaeon]
MSERILVTGGAGFIGSFVCEELLKTGKEVVALDDLSVGKREYVPKGAEFAEGSIMDKILLDKLVSSCDKIYHLAVVALPISLKNPVAAHDVNATGTVNLLEAARKYGKGFVYVSSSEVYGNAKEENMKETHQLEPRTPYAASKLAGEVYALSYCRTFGLPVVVVRPFNSFGPHHREDSYSCVVTRFIKNVQQNKPIVIFGDGEQSRDYTYVKDTARGIVICGENAKLGDVVNIGYGKDITINEIARIIKSSIGVEAKITYANERPGDVRRLCADTSKARKLGFEPAYSFSTGLEEYLEWLKRY